MKTNVLKSSFAAFAFTLAIVASFAFSAPPAVQKYIDTTVIPNVCTIVPEGDRVNTSECKINFTGEICTSNIDGNLVQIYSDAGCSLPANLLQKEF